MSWILGVCLLPLSPLYFILALVSPACATLQADKGVSVRSVDEHVLVELEHDVIHALDPEALPYL